MKRGSNEIFSFPLACPIEGIEWKHDGNMLETMGIEHINDGIEWKHHGNYGNRAT